MIFDFEAPLARKVGEEAANACADKAERQGWDKEGAARFIHGWLIRHGELSGEELTNQAKAHGFRPHDDRAFGSVYQSLVRNECIRCVGFCERRKGHGTAGGRIWKAVE